MKKIIDKIAGGIVNHHKALLVFMVILTLGAGLLTLQVNVNADMTQYLPDDSTMKQGIDLMEAEFPDLEQDQTIRVMFKGLSDTEKTAIATELSQIDYVDHVDFEVGDEAYDKGDYTLYIVNTTYDYGTQEEHAIERAIADQYSQQEPDIVNDSTDGELPLWVALLAFAILLVILLIMCASWVEPFLFLVAIGMAVVLNMGTNAIFESVSKTTFQIAAILQLVLSMDYSIILMNRFRQESLKRDDKYEAMKHALSNAFSSIGSSAMTTIVGLLMLVFMSFKIGADLGLVLAKGVALSLVTVFTVLPVLILFADGLIKKTSKKSLHINMTKIAAFSYRFRKGIAVVFFVLLIGSFFLKNITQMTFTMSKEDPIADVFQKSNPIVMLYDNEDEDQLSDLIKQVEANPYVKDLSSYQTTLGKAYTVDDLAQEMVDSDADFSFDPDMLKILYYDYYQAGKTHAMTMTDFLNFLSEDVKNNPQFSDRLDDDMKANLDQLSTFTDKETLTQPLSAEALANQFGMDADDISQLFMFYFSQKGDIDSGQMTLSQLTDFIVNDLANDPQYASMFDAQTLSQMKSLSLYTNRQEMTRARSYEGLASLLGMTPEEMKILVIYYQSMQRTYNPPDMTLAEFVSFMQSDTLMANPAIGGQMDASMKEQLMALSTFTNQELITSPLPADQMAQMMGMSPEQVAGLYQIYFAEQEGPQVMTMVDFVDYVLNDISTQAHYASQFDPQVLSNLQMIQGMMQATLSGMTFDSVQMSQMLSMSQEEVRLIYTLNDSQSHIDDWKMSPQTTINFLVNHQDMLGESLSASQLGQLQMASGIINTAVANRALSSNQSARLLGMDQQEAQSIYLLKQLKEGTTEAWTLSIENFVNFILDDVSSQEAYADQFDSKTLEELNQAQVIIEAVIDGKLYTSEEMASLLEGMSEDLTDNNMNLMYLYKSSLDYSQPDWTMTIDNLFAYLDERVIDDPRFAEMISDQDRQDILEMKEEIDDGLEQLIGPHYSIMIIDTTLPDESSETTAFVNQLKEVSNENLRGDYYLIGNSPMSVEMAGSFGSEMTMITILTALAIFIVVAITFRSLTIPLALVLIVQCGVFITITSSGLRGIGIYYLASLIVQCILMGATIDYGILFSSYYRENRHEKGLKESLISAYEGSIHTIMTSGSVMVFVLGIIGVVPTDPSIQTICQTLAVGTLTAIILILFVLPGLLASFDKWIAGKGVYKEMTNKSK